MATATSLENATIRVDHASKRASLVDVAQMVLDCGEDEAKAALHKLLGSNADVDEDCPRRQINNRGGFTQVADVGFLIEIIWLLPAEIADDIRRKMCHSVCKLCGGDARLVGEAEERHIAMREASLRAKAQTGKKDNMPVGFELLGVHDQEKLAKQMVEQFLKGRDQGLRRKALELEEAKISLKRKRCDTVIYIYQSLEKLDITLDSRAQVHILDTIAQITKPDISEVV
ncbi:unnamed protein product [Laminaria digitata]